MVQYNNYKDKIMGESIKVWELDFINLDEEKYGSFSHFNPYDDSVAAQSKQNSADFKETPEGKAQCELLIEQMKGQMAAQGIVDYEPTDASLDAALRSAQIAQEYGQAPELTNQELLETHGPSWLEEIGSLISNFSNAVQDKTSELGKDGLRLAVDGVKSNDGLLGNASDAIINREEQVNSEINGPTNSTPAP
ncbi:MAG: hypothetical protein COB14_07930 [Alphaproteobacteria bacterium]|nr:MAG: hypothetical protein COB14_07930 [Alphaproteobacteria bacterium]